MYSVRYYLQLHVTAVGLGTYYSWIRGHYCTLNLLIPVLRRFGSCD
jgi:hypothetical protein